MSELRIGISGWRYPGWRGVFYPKGLAQRRELEFAARHFDSVEINGSFYSLQRPEYYAAWCEETPPGFVFAVKGGRYITHLKQLHDIEAPLANFFASGVLALGDKLGPILWQLPERLPFDARFERFLKLLPRDTYAAAALARGHDARLAGRSFVAPGLERRVRHAIEVRSPTFACREAIELMRRYGVALVIADTAGNYPYFEDITADFVYVRLHGDEQLYMSGYSPAALERWAKRIRTWRSGREPRDAVRIAPRAPAQRGQRDVYVYFDNDGRARAPFDAISLAELLGKPASPLVLPSSEASPRQRRAASGRGRAASPRLHVEP